MQFQFNSDSSVMGTDDVAERILGVIGDSYPDSTIDSLDPFVLVGIAAIFGNVHQCLLIDYKPEDTAPSPRRMRRISPMYWKATT